MPKRYLVDIELRRTVVKTFTIETSDPTLINELAIDKAIEHEWPEENDHAEVSVLYYCEEEKE